MRKQHTAIQHLWCARLLAVTYLLYWGSFSAHHWLEDTHHHTPNICHTADGEKHIHDDTYGASDCFVCHLAPSLAELPAWLLPELKDTRTCYGNPQEVASAVYSAPPTGLFQPRAPPI